MAINKVFLRTPYNYDTDEVSNETGLRCKEPGRTQQNFKEECDINAIVGRWIRTGEPPGSSRQPQYGDFTGESDYHSLCNRMLKSRDNFFTLPEHIRLRFDNDPSRLISFLDDPKNRAEGERLGLFKKSATIDDNVVKKDEKKDAVSIPENG